jgi:Nucleoside-diphosphate-sugar pyrophosphorylase involved in lipopolysaccharide biosynthesis/translation initiation factor 2B, gamma/epsilon subunits (eIF-2Bgamma/eIF-2Bepsilon)
MLPINGIPNLQRIVELMRDQLDIREIVIVTGYCAEVIEDHFGDGRAFGVRIHFVRNTDLDRGLAWSVLLGRSISAPSSASSSRTSATWPPTTTNCSSPAGGARLPPAG